MGLTRTGLTDYQVLHSPFDPEIHKKQFVNYLEVVILPSGKIEYAVPSHDTKVYRLFLAKRGIPCSDNVYDLHQAIDKCFEKSPDRWCPLDACMKETRTICVWTDYVKCCHNPTIRQVRALQKLADLGLYQGDLLQLE